MTKPPIPGCIILIVTVILVTGAGGFVVDAMRSMNQATTARRQTHFYEGQWAGRIGQSCQACPYSGATDKEDWLKGWAAGDEERRSK